jgi:glycosyltransferase involved in cell wall biosynthesis
VLIPAYNASAHLAAAIQSVLGQTYPPAEVLLIDDGSTDATPDIARSFGRSITYVRQKHQGVSAARNLGLALASGEYVALLDADDVCHPERLARQLQVLTAFPKCVGCFTGYWVFSNGRRLSVTRPDPNSAYALPLVWLYRCQMLPASILIRRESAQGIEFPLTVRNGEDVIFLALLRTRGPFCLCPEPLYGYRQWHGQTTRRLTEVEGFRQRLAWARANWRSLDPETSLGEVETTLWLALAKQLESHYWRRRREHFFRLRRYLLANWPSALPCPAVFSWRWYPECLWRVKGWLDRLTGRGQ